MASKTTGNIDVNPTKDNFYLGKDDGVSVAINNRNTFGLEFKIRVEKYNAITKKWDISKALEMSEGGMQAKEKITDTYLFHYFFKSGVGTYRLYMEFYQFGTAKPMKVGYLTTSSFYIKK
ncbi:hypothetical protein BMT55_11560 [Listeria newyorkensis]|uniref:Uncharacterized protein n=1 Tax=Listeria newyorkensis TaxID=1497681 RepID=A0ABX4XKL3_9LIST|nr:hypothetical protein [Listeria newyorkensis]PNP90610.1 hypothetical protein BMT55_11560 [Listeria newyorkensis]